MTLTGTAGVGKTSLALQVAGEIGGSFELAALAELAPLSDPSLVPQTVARALGIRLGDAPRSDVLGAHLKERSALLILDNFEHVLPASAWVAELLARCERLTILATSREPLHLTAERVFLVAPLRGAAALQLFERRAQMVRPEFGVTAENRADLDSIVAHLGGLPLAIELAAARLAMLSPKALALRLQRRLPLLGGGAIDRPARQQTIDRAIAWSYDLLDGDEQRVLRRLSVLRGGGSLDDARAIADVVSDVDATVGRLADKNLLLVREHDAGERRIAILELVREFAYERLVESGELSDAQRRHAQAVLATLRRENAKLAGAQQHAALERFERYDANLRAALEWAHRERETSCGCDLVRAAWRYWNFRGYQTEGVDWVEKFLVQRAASPEGASDEQYSAVLNAQATLRCSLGHGAGMLDTCREAIALQRVIGNDAELAASLTTFGLILQYTGAYAAARDAYGEVLAIARRDGDDASAAAALSGLASVAFGENDFIRSSEYAGESAAIYRRLEHDWGLTHALMKLGVAAFGEGDYPRAEAFFSEALELQQAIGSFAATNYTLANLGTIARKTGRYPLALTRFGEALDRLEVSPNAYSLAGVLEEIAATLLALGDAAKGARLLGAADELRCSLGLERFPVERIEYDDEVREMRERLGSEGFEANHRIGASLPLERVLEEAREARASSKA